MQIQILFEMIRARKGSKVGHPLSRFSDKSLRIKAAFCLPLCLHTFWRDFIKDALEYSRRVTTHSLKAFCFQPPITNFFFPPKKTRNQENSRV